MPKTEVTGRQIKDQSVDLTVDVTGVLPVANGGSGCNTIPINSVVLGNGTGAVQSVAPGTSGNVLTSNGGTWVSSAPASVSGTASSATKLETARTIQTNLASTSSASFDGTASVSPGVSGTLPVSNGGTGVSTLPSNAVLLGNSTSAVQTVAPGTSGNVLTSDGTTWKSSAASLSSPTISGNVLPASGYSSDIGSGSLPFNNITAYSLTALGYVTLNTTLNASSGTQYGLQVTPTVSQTSTAGYTALRVNSTQSSTGSGTKLLADLQLGGTSKFSVDTAGTVTTAGAIELGNASDTTLSRSAAGKLAVEGVDVVLTGGALGTPSSGTLTNCTSLPVSGITASTSTALGVGSIELGHASDTTVTRSAAGKIAVEGVDVVLTGGALGTPASGTLTNCTSLPVSGITASTSTALGVGSIELGHASDTTLTRAAAGRVAVEGVNVVTTSSTDTLINKTLTTPKIDAIVSPSGTTNIYIRNGTGAGSTLDVYAPGNDHAAHFNTADSAGGSHAAWMQRTGSTGSLIGLYYSGNTTLVGNITTNGSSTTYGTTSDYRLKENVEPLSGGTATIDELNPVKYEWKSSGAYGDGFLAHELQAVIPEAVDGEKDAVDANGKIKPQVVDLGKIVPHLVCAVQELKAELDSAKQRISALEAQVNK